MLKKVCPIPRSRWLAMASYFVDDAFSCRRLKEMAFVERIMDINFCVRLGKRTTETYEILKKAEGKERVEDDKRSGRPQTSRTAENIEKVSVASSNNSRIKWDILSHMLTDTD
ncbi:hypothetical protein TNCV_2623051 [Trichonephila clavipes]|nr:hypothetical protein TNCV_2623051 [Trichonephila clavipes]